MRQPQARHALLLLLAWPLLAVGTGIAQPPGPRVYVTNSVGGPGGNSVSVIDAGANIVVATIPVGEAPSGIAVTPDGTRAYVANQGGGTVSVIDTASNTVAATVDMVPNAKAVAVSPDGSVVYVTRTGYDRIARIDTATNTLVDNLLIYDPWYLAFTPNGSALYVSHSNLLKVSAIDPTTGAVVATVSLPFNPTVLAVTPDGAFVYVGSLDNRVSVIQTATNTLVATVPLLEPVAGVGGLAVTPDGSRVYAVQVNQISVIDTVTNTIVAAVPLEGASYGAIAFTSGSCVRAYVGHFNTVWVLKPAPVDFVMGEVPVGPIPSSIAVSPPPRNIGTWLVGAPMPTPRAHLAAATAVGADGKSRIYAIGGRNAENIALNTVEAYDPTTDTWTTVASMSTPRALLAAATGPDGRIYAIGGQNQVDLATVEAYDPMTDSWATVASVQGQSYEGVPGRAGHAAASLADGRIYAAGGFASFDPEVSLAVGTASVEAYDANGDVWSFVAPIPHFGVGRYLLAAAAGPDGRLYGIGGAVRDAVGSEFLYRSVSAYDSNSDTWSSVANLSLPRFALAAATGPDDKIYAIGGMSLTDTGRYLTLDFVDAYDPPTDSWGSCGCLPTSLRSGLAAARGADGRIYVIGGLDHNGHALDTLEAYAPP